MNSKGFGETLSEDNRKGPTEKKMAENNAWGKEEAKAGTEGPHDQDQKPAE